jgi:hypothetical protein
VAVVLVALVSLGVLRLGAGLSDKTASTTAVDAPAATANADAPSLEAGAAGEDTLSGLTAGTGAGATATTTASATTMTGEGGNVATIRAAGPSIQDRTGMIDGMTAVTGSPAYFTFASPAGTATRETDPGPVTGAGASESVQTTIADPVVGEDGLLTTEQVGAISAQITALTGLQPLEEGLALSRPTFAAYVPRDQAIQFIDLLRSIAASANIEVGLAQEPGTALVDWTKLLMERKTVLVVLSAQQIAPPTSPWSFTTSTLTPLEVTNPGDVPDVTMPDDAGTHVLVVILMNSLP